MTWFFIALINPVAHALVNHFDKYIITKYFRGESVGALILFSALFAVFLLPLVWFINPTVLSEVDHLKAMVLMINGALLVGAIILYLYALRDNEASYVAPYFQLVPVFSFFLGYAFLGEILTHNQLWAALLLIGGSLVFSIDLTGDGKRFNKRLTLFMFGSSLLYAVNAVIFKAVAVDLGFMDSLFWDLLGKFLFGLLLFIFVASYRHQFLEVIRTNKVVPIALNSLNEILALVGEIALVYAVLLAPVVLVQSIGGLQPAFVFIIGVMITLFFPQLVKESLKTKLLVQKIIGITIISAGVFFIK